MAYLKQLFPLPTGFSFQPSSKGWKHKAIFVKFEPILEVDNDPVKVAVADNLHGVVFNSEKNVEPEPTVSITTLVEERFWNMPQKIKETCDAIYIVVVFLKDLKQWAEEDRQKMDSYLMSKHGSHLVSDMALLENQLLLDHTINVVQNLDQAVIETIKFMLKESKGPSPSIIYLKLPFNREDFHEVIPLFCWYYYPFYAEKKKFHGRLAKELITKSTLLECLHYCPVRPTKDDQAVITTNPVWSIPTAKELAWSGVRFEADPDGAIQVQFAEPVFKLPALVFNTKIEIVVSNLMALERSKLQLPLSRLKWLIYYGTNGYGCTVGYSYLVTDFIRSFWPICNKS